MWKSIASNFLTVLIVGLFVLGGLIGWGQSQYNSDGPLESATFFEVPRGASLRSVSEKLEAQGAISNASIFRIGAGLGEPLPEAYTEAVAAELPIVYRLAVAEGLTSWQIVEGMKGADFLEGGVAELPAEGSLAPDTYEVKRGAVRGEILDRMAQAQTRILEEAWANRAEGLPLETKEEALVLASIVEKETGVAEERRQVASVFINRLNQGMKSRPNATQITSVRCGFAAGVNQDFRGLG